MSIDPPVFSFYDLAEDILLYIFTMNANIFEDMYSEPNAFNITRITSQVCQHWRIFDYLMYPVNINDVDRTLKLQVSNTEQIGVTTRIDEGARV